MRNESCFCESNTFHVQIADEIMNHIRLICAHCKCERVVRTPRFACHYAIEPALVGYEVNKATGMMFRSEDYNEVSKV